MLYHIATKNILGFSIAISLVQIEQQKVIWELYPHIAWEGNSQFQE